MTDWNILFCVDHRGAPATETTPLQLRLARLGIETRRPLDRQIRRVGALRKRKPFDVPRFPGYIFAHASADTCAIIDRERPRGVVGWVYANGALASISEEAVRSMMEDSADQPEQLFEEGAEVTYRFGPLSDLPMIVEKAEDGAVSLSTPLFGGRTVTARPQDLRKA